MSASNSEFLTKFETKSNRVKGLSFHPRRPWIVASLHNGVIQLWDYRMGTLLDRFEEHEGPVRGVNFHQTQPLLVSGGDDYKIKIWNYKLRRCLKPDLLGHLDYIRTVQFHHEYPWVVSSSDDQTVRIWDWQQSGRPCLVVLTGHNHYVMSVQFHPREDLIVSASLDQTVRVWDISGLKKKYVGHGVDDMQGQTSVPKIGADLFGSTDTTVKYLLEGHDRGVNWASFHHTLPLIVSGADDRQVKLWRMNDSKAWEVDTLRGHVNNVSCVLFHPKQELIISNSEDKSIRVWDMSKRTGVQTFRREQDRFWILAVHKDQGLLAAGHDSGMLVFKLDRERPAFAMNEGGPNTGSQLLYVKERYLRMFEPGSGRDIPLVSIRRSSGPNSAPRSMVYNEAERSVLMCTDAEGGSYELYQIPRDASKGAQESVDSKRGLGLAAVFVARNRFAVLDKSRQILIKNLSNEVTKKLSPPHATTDMIFYAGTGMLLCKAEDKITLFDLQQKRAMGEITCPNVKYVVWASDMKHVAFLSKHTVVLARRDAQKLEHLATVHETIRVKSGVWEEGSTKAFIYTTLNHVKFCLTQGDSGIIRTLEAPVYLCKVMGNKLFCLDRESNTLTLSIDKTEFLFKVALLDRNYDEVLRIIKRSKLCGQAIIGYLQKKGFPEVALQFVNDEKTRFNLAIECGNIEVALASASALDDKDCWHKLGVEALRQGNHQIVEMAYQKTKDFERLSFLYLITGNTEKLNKMLRIAEMRGDVMGRFHNALYLGDVNERIKILKDQQQLALAYLTAVTHGVTDAAAEIEALIPEELLPSCKPKADASLLFPPTPIFRENNWPLLRVSKGYFDGPVEKVSESKLNEELDGDIGGGWGGDDLDLPGEGGGDVVQEEDADMGGEGWGGDGVDLEDGTGETGDGWGIDELDLDLPGGGAATGKSPGGNVGGFFAPPTMGTPAALRWQQASNVPGEHVAAGSFQSAMELMNRQAGVVNFEPMKPIFTSVYLGAQSFLSGSPGAAIMECAMHRNNENYFWSARGTDGMPAVCATVPTLTDRIKSGYKAFTEGKLPEALQIFVYSLQSVLVACVDSKQELDELREQMGICKEYITAIILETTRREQFKEDPTRNVELAAYLTHCNLQPLHLLISLRSAMSSSVKIKNYNTAGSFCRRLLELNPKAEHKEQALKVLKVCEANRSNEVELQYDERNPFVVCTKSFVPIYRGKPITRCGFCSAPFDPAFKGQVCAVCQVGEIGLKGTGLINSRHQRNKQSSNDMGDFDD
ncbi:coatomer subunit alpha [Guillardia theta CCMP2712]|uniref:Coatomer subunit alpha n=1 Tax=Guillardia theta (strain CCMP2712) TaxID=905079 RepID=L1JYZ3_GUITC|nr:coatomer subunit alpha [Guillardia theta CCMP2712]EKX53298.1 coatomer subunit alpha [Guillardia theta CCMP2712]|mmetsp:Transcript_4441/g.16198  ORF Transcript_4441/g.16198 Transcript_4441/m.16198 type:complete len:1271 (-) Transcript_4441:1990-5802(-)|eukprot:XP_005840278.1 coatomer subunit alpha [Guillardia theta CCMP2712]